MVAHKNPQEGWKTSSEAMPPAPRPKAMLQTSLVMRTHAKAPNHAALCPRGCGHPMAAEFGTIPLLFITSCSGAFIMPLTPTARKAGRMVSGTSSL